MIKVTVVEDQTIVREGILRLLDFSKDIEVIGQAACGREALRSIKDNCPDVLLLDIQMPDMNGFEVLQALNHQSSSNASTQFKTILLTTFDDRAYVQKAQQMGVEGFLLKDVSFDELVDAIKRVYAGEKLIHSHAVESSGENLDSNSNSNSQSPLESLTPREREIFSMLCEGMANKEVARSLQLSEGTIKNHVSNILSKLGVRDRTQAVVKFGGASK